MKDFFKQFKENLENRPEPPHEEHLWQRLNRDLNNEDKPKGAGFGWWWVLGAFCFLLLGSNIYSLLALQKVNQQIQILEQKTDTVYLTNVATKMVYQTDTLVQTKTIREKIIRYVSAPLTNNFSQGIENNNLYQPLGSTKNSSTKTNGNSNAGLYTYSDLLTNYIYNKNTSSSSSPNIAHVKDDKIIHYTSLTGLPLLEMETVDNDLTFVTKAALPLLETNKRKTARQRLYAMRPKGFQIGISAGATSIVNKDLKKGLGFSTGLNTAILFSPKLQLWVNASYHRMDVKSGSFNNTTPGVSEDPPIGSNFQFFNAEANPDFLQFSIGLQYSFNTNKKWNPFLGLGYASEHHFSYYFNYEYNVPSNPALEWSTHEYIPELSIYDLLLLRTGIVYQVSDHWNWQIKADYRSDIKKRKLLAPGLINLQAGVNYTF